MPVILYVHAFIFLHSLLIATFVVHTNEFVMFNIISNCEIIHDKLKINSHIIILNKSV